MSEFSEYASWAGMFMGFVAIVPKMISVITRRRTLDVRGEISRFEVILKAQDGQLDGCREECERLRTALQKEVNDRTREREYFFRQMGEATRRVNDCEGLLRRMGIKDERKERRTSA